MSNEYDDSKRSKKLEPAAASIARVLEAAGLPVPRRLDEIMETPVYPIADLAQARRDRVDARLATRRARLLELGWSAYALDHAAAPDETEAVLAVNGWSASRGPRASRILVLSGKKGSGKTVACARLALTNESAAAFRFVRASTLMRHGRFGSEMEDAITAPALCLDDLGAEYLDPKGSFISDLDELVDRFYSDRRRLLITTNLGGAELERRCGGRVVRRLDECSTWITLRSGSIWNPDDIEPIVDDDRRPPWERS